MIKKQQNKVVEFTNLPEDHKAEFIQFLIKNNICFQEGKDNCVAKVEVKNHKAKTITHQSNRVTQNKSKRVKENNNKSLHLKQKKTEPKELQVRNDILNRPTNNQNSLKPLKTPRKQAKQILNRSSLSQKKHNQTAKKNHPLTPNKRKQKLKEAISLSAVNHLKLTPQSHSKTIIQENRKSNSKEILCSNENKDYIMTQNQKGKLKIQAERQKVVNKYANVFDLGQKGRPVKWPVNMLERTIEEIYDDIFIRNNQCLQSKNINYALKTLIQLPFSQLVEAYFYKKFKGSKLANSNLNNMLYSLSYYTGRQNCSIFVLTFQNFILGELQNQDLLYYLFTRNILKKELRINDKMKDISRNLQGTYFVDHLKIKDINKILRGIIGRDSQLINQYKSIISIHMINEQIPAYDLLRILVEDYHLKRVTNKLGNSNRQSFGNILIQRDGSYQCKNTEQLTFGEDHEDQNDESVLKYSQFWNCLDYSHVKDSLFELIMQKMSQKVNQLLEILIIDMDNAPMDLNNLSSLLYKKSESMVKAVFEMNKMKWFKELSIANPSQNDMNLVESIQIRLRQLRQNPSGRQIGQFCKNILTTKALVNELQLSLLVND